MSRPTLQPTATSTSPTTTPIAPPTTTPDGVASFSVSPGVEQVTVRNADVGVELALVDATSRRL
ncbi:MAG: hypothetical protein R2697_02785 [Ilumatobacteraceae bacterium]